MCNKNIKYEIPYSAFPYDFRANYSRAGRLGHNFCGNTSGVADVDALYGYDVEGATHQPRVVFDYKSGIKMNLYWDHNGNLAQLQGCKGDISVFTIGMRRIGYAWW